MDRILSSFLALLLFLGAWGGGSCVLVAGNERPEKKVNRKQSGGLILAVVGPRSGIYAYRFDEILLGVSEGLRQLGGQLPVQILSFDDTCNAKGGRAAALKIAASGADVVIGHPCPSAANTAYDVYQKSGIISFFLGHRHGKDFVRVPLEQRFVFQILRSQQRSSDLIAQSLVSLAGGKQVALIHDKTVFSRDLSSQIEEFLRPTGGFAPKIIGIDGAKKDYRSVVAKLIEADVGAVHFSGFEPEARIFLENLMSSQGSLTFLGAETLVTPSFLKFVDQILGGQNSVADFVSQSSGISIGLSVPFTSQSLKTFANAKTSGGFQATFRAAGLVNDAKTAVQIWLASFEKNAERSLLKSVEAISRRRFQTISGPITFHENGLAERASTGLVMFRKGRWDPFEPKE